MGVDLDVLELMATMLENSDRGAAGAQIRAAIAEIRELREVKRVLCDRGWRGEDQASPSLPEAVGLMCDIIEVHQRDQERQNLEIRELRGRPAVPTWTKDRPTVPGWYWQRGYWTYEAPCPVKILEPRKDWKTGELRWFVAAPVQEFTDRMDGCEWSGPIPMPAEPPKGEEEAQP